MPAIRRPVWYQESATHFDMAQLPRYAWSRDFCEVLRRVRKIGCRVSILTCEINGSAALRLSNRRLGIGSPVEIKIPLATYRPLEDGGAFSSSLFQWSRSYYMHRDANRASAEWFWGIIRKPAKIYISSDMLRRICDYLLSLPRRGCVVFGWRASLLAQSNQNLNLICGRYVVLSPSFSITRMPEQPTLFEPLVFRNGIRMTEMPEVADWHPLPELPESVKLRDTWFHDLPYSRLPSELQHLAAPPQLPF